MFPALGGPGHELADGVGWVSGSEFGESLGHPSVRVDAGLLQFSMSEAMTAQLSPRRPLAHAACAGLGGAGAGSKCGPNSTTAGTNVEEASSADDGARSWFASCLCKSFRQA